MTERTGGAPGEHYHRCLKFHQALCTAMSSQAATHDEDELERTRTLLAAPVLDAASSDDIDEDTAVLEQIPSEVPDDEAPEGASEDTPEDAPEDVFEIEVELDLSDAPTPPRNQEARAPAESEASDNDLPVDAASQALELAALRAEVARLNREHLELHRLLRLRDRWVQTLQEELNSAQSQFRETTCLLSEAQVQLVLLKESQAQTERQAKRPTVVDKIDQVDEIDEIDEIEEIEEIEEIDSFDEIEEIELFAPPIPAAREQPVSDDLARTQRIPPGATSADALLASQATDTEPLPEGRCLVPLEPRGAVIVLKLETTTVGRARRNNICISSLAVSRDHARIVVSGGHVTVFDMDSANGCYVNDDRIKQQKIFDGDVLRLGDCSYLFADNQS